MTAATKHTKQELKQRLRSSLSYLQERSPDLSYSDLALLMEVNPMTLRAIFAPASPYMSTELVEKYASLFPETFSREWLLNGTGEMLLADAWRPRPEHACRWQRIRQVMEREGLDYRSLAVTIGLDPSATHRIIRGLSRPQTSTLQQLQKAFPKYRMEWLLLGKEPIEIEPLPIGQEADTDQIMATLAGEQCPEANAKPFLPEAMMSIPVVDAPAVAGRLTGYGDPVPAEDLRILNVPVDRIHSGEYRIFTVYGISMDDGTLMGLADGDQVLARKVSRDYWWEGLHIHTWLYFIFVTRDQGIIVKRVIKQDCEQRTFTLHSLNPDFADFTVHESDIYAIYNVIKVIDRELKCGL